MRSGIDRILSKSMPMWIMLINPIPYQFSQRFPSSFLREKGSSTRSSAPKATILYLSKMSAQDNVNIISLNSDLTVSDSRNIQKKCFAYNWFAFLAMQTNRVGFRRDVAKVNTSPASNACETALEVNMSLSCVCPCRYPPAEGSMKLAGPAVSIVAPPTAPPLPSHCRPGL